MNLKIKHTTLPYGNYHSLSMHTLPSRSAQRVSPQVINEEMSETYDKGAYLHFGIVLGSVPNIDKPGIISF